MITLINFYSINYLTYLLGSKLKNNNLQLANAYVRSTNEIRKDQENLIEICNVVLDEKSGNKATGLSIEEILKQKLDTIYEKICIENFNIRHLIDPGALKKVLLKNVKCFSDLKNDSCYKNIIKPADENFIHVANRILLKYVQIYLEHDKTFNMGISLLKELIKNITDGITPNIMHFFIEPSNYQNPQFSHAFQTMKNEIQNLLIYISKNKYKIIFMPVNEISDEVFPNTKKETSQAPFFDKSNDLIEIEVNENVYHMSALNTFKNMMVSFFIEEDLFRFTYLNLSFQEKNYDIIKVTGYPQTFSINYSYKSEFLSNWDLGVQFNFDEYLKLCEENEYETLISRMQMVAPVIVYQNADAKPWLINHLLNDIFAKSCQFYKDQTDFEKTTEFIKHAQFDFIKARLYSEFWNNHPEYKKIIDFVKAVCNFLIKMVHLSLYEKDIAKILLMYIHAGKNTDIDVIEDLIFNEIFKRRKYHNAYNILYTNNKEVAIDDFISCYPLNFADLHPWENKNISLNGALKLFQTAKNINILNKSEIKDIFLFHLNSACYEDDATKNTKIIEILHVLREFWRLLKRTPDCMDTNIKLNDEDRLSIIEHCWSKIGSKHLDLGILREEDFNEVFHQKVLSCYYGNTEESIYTNLEYRMRTFNHYRVKNLQPDSLFEDGEKFYKHNLTFISNLQTEMWIEYYRRKYTQLENIISEKIEALKIANRL